TLARRSLGPFDQRIDLGCRRCGRRPRYDDLVGGVVVAVIRAGEDGALPARADVTPNRLARPRQRARVWRARRAALLVRHGPLLPWQTYQRATPRASRGRISAGGFRGGAEP